MKLSKVKLLFVLTYGLIWFVLPLAEGQVVLSEEQEPLPNVDVSRDNLGDGLIANTVVTGLQEEALEQMQEENPELQLDWNPITGTPHRLFVRGGFLKEGTDSQGIIASNAEDTLRQFIEDEAELFNLTPNDLETLFVVRDTSTEGSGIIAEEVKGLQNVTFDQHWQERQIYPVSLSGTLSADQNSILSLSGDIVPNLESAINATEPTLSALDALEKAADSIETSFDPQEHPLLEDPEGPELRQTFDKGEDFEYDVPVRLIYFLVAKDDVRLVWEATVVAKGSSFMYQVLVDALNGEILLRENLTQSEQAIPRWLVYADVFNNPTTDPKDDYQPADNPAPLSPGPATPDGTQGNPISATIIQTNGDPTASPNGWIEDGQMSTTGNNVIAFVDQNGNRSADEGEQPTATLEDVDGISTRTFNFPADFSAAPDTEANRNATTTNTFFMANWYHDRLFLLGFTEEAGNFQNVNFSAPTARGGDPIFARLQVGTNNSTFGTPASDGTCCPVLNAFTWTGPDPDRDSGFDTEILIHEFTHGLTNRIIGGPNVSGLSGIDQPRGLGEGYSDAFAYLLLRQPAEDTNGNYVVGSYSTFELDTIFGTPPNWDDNYYFGIRHFPYSTDFCVNPFTLEDMQPGSYDITPPSFSGCTETPPVSPWLANTSGGPHDKGEIWALTLWEVRSNLVNKHEFDVGNELMLQLLTDSLFLLNRNPTFIEARDALLSADVGRTNGANQCLIWEGFAKRGLGFVAQTPTTGAFTEDFSLPPECPDNPDDPNDPNDPDPEDEVPPQISNFTATPNLITNDGSSTLTWGVTGTEPISLMIDQGVGIVTDDSTTVSPTTTTDYKLTASNSVGDVSKEVTVTFDKCIKPKGFFEWFQCLFQ